MTISNLEFFFEKYVDCYLVKAILNVCEVFIHSSTGYKPFIRAFGWKKFLNDNYWLGKEKPCITYGLRGICYFFIEIECTSKDLHSGVFGGTVHEGMADLMHMMNTLIDKDGKILVDGIMDEVAPVTPGKSITSGLPERFRTWLGLTKFLHPFH